MRKNIFLGFVLACIAFSCTTSDSTQSGVQSALDEWFPQQYQVVKEIVTVKDSLASLLVQSKADPKLQFSIDYYAKKENGGLVKDSIQSAIELAKVNAQPAQELLAQLQKNGLKNVVVGTDMAQNAVNIQIYEKPFNSIFGSRIKQIQKISAEWAEQRNMAPCRLTLLVMEPEAWGKKFPEVMDARFVNRNDNWIYQNTIADARADLADPASAEFLPGSLRLRGDLELEIRQKAHAEVKEFLRTSEKKDFHVELVAMVNTEWDLRNMEKIRYFFPYCQESQSTKENKSCMGNFDGRISCWYDLNTGEMQVDF